MDVIAENMDNFAHFVGVGGEMSYAPGHRFRREEGFPYFTLGCMVEGASTIWVGNSVYQRTAGSLSLVPPNMPYRVEVPGPHRGLWLIFDPRPEWRAYLDWSLAAAHQAVYPFVALPPAPEGDLILACLRQTILYLGRTGPKSMRLAELSFEQALIHIVEIAREAVPDHRLTHVVECLQRDMARSWCEAELAALANLSVSGFAHLFRRTMGVPPKRFLEQIRMEQAKNLLLSSGDSIKTVAYAVGFPDPLHFSNRFRRCVGCSPLMFRKKGFQR